MCNGGQMNFFLSEAWPFSFKVSYDFRNRHRASLDQNNQVLIDPSLTKKVSGMLTRDRHNLEKINFVA